MIMNLIRFNKVLLRILRKERACTFVWKELMVQVNPHNLKA
jgi:hypothetical protein